MTYVEWIQTRLIDNMQPVTAAEAWRAGALAMLQALIDRGHIAYGDGELARMSTEDIWEIDAANLELHMA